MTATATLPLHLGSLHPWEQTLTLVLAFGPFLLLGAVIWWRRRHEPAEAADPAEPAETPVPPEAPAPDDDRTDQPAR